MGKIFNKIFFLNPFSHSNLYEATAFIFDQRSGGEILSIPGVTLPPI